MTRSRLFWIVVALTLVDYLVMIAWSIPRLTADAGGLAIFDMRPAGYSFEEARALLAAFSPAGVAFYENVQHRLDAAYPALLALTLAWAILRLSPRSWGLWRHLLAATALPGMVFDYWENAGVSAMLAAGPGDITPEMAAAASLHSQLKAGFSTVAMTILMVLLMRWAVRRWRSRRRPA